MAERVQDYDLVRASINQAQTGIPGIRLPEDVPLLGHGAQGWVFYAEETESRSKTTNTCLWSSPDTARLPTA